MCERISSFVDRSRIYLHHLKSFRGWVSWTSQKIVTFQLLQLSTKIYESYWSSWQYSWLLVKTIVSVVTRASRVFMILEHLAKNLKKNWQSVDENKQKIRQHRHTYDTWPFCYRTYCHALICNTFRSRVTSTSKIDLVACSEKTVQKISNNPTLRTIQFWDS